VHSADASMQVMSDYKVALHCATLLLNDELVEQVFLTPLAMVGHAPMHVLVPLAFSQFKHTSES
jgi:hypothetical protein